MSWSVIMWQPRKEIKKGYRNKVWLGEGPPTYHQQYVDRFQQLHRILHKLLLVSVLACTAPISSLPNCQTHLHRLLNLVWMILWYGFFILASYWEFQLFTFQKVALDRYLNAIESGIYVIHIASILLLTLQWRNRITKVLKKIIKSDMERGYATDVERSKGFISLQLCLVWIFTCLALVIDIWSNRCVIYKSILSIGSFVLPNIVSSLSFVQYYVLLREVAWRQANLTESLERELFQLLNPRKAQIQKLRLQQAELTHFTRMVNRTYQYSIVLLFVGCFLNFNLVLFLVFQGIENPAMSPLSKWLNMLLWLAMHLGKVFSILYFNQKVLNEQTKCLDLINGIPNPGADLQETFNHFVLQLQTDVRQHVVGGVIILDLKFVTTLLVASADLFIFLLQYDVTYEALTKSLQGNSTKA